VLCIIAAACIATQSDSARPTLHVNSREATAETAHRLLPNSPPHWTRAVAHGTLDAHPAVSTLLNTLALKGGRRCECNTLRRSAAPARVRMRSQCRHREGLPPVPLCMRRACCAGFMEETLSHVVPGNGDVRRAMALV